MGRITVRAEPLFDEEDPAEDRALFRLANRLHRTTRESVIRDQLLFRSGEAYSPALVAESERVLRGDEYLYDGRVRPAAVHDGVVDVEVVTRDVWTLNAGIRFRREGGAQSSALRVEDSNFLGLGKYLVLEHSNGIDRDSERLEYFDPNVLGSRVRLETRLEDNSDGGGVIFALGKPFESLDSRWAAGLRLARLDKVDPLYSLGRVTDRFRHRSTFAELSAGRSNGLRDGRAVRWSAGLTYRQDLFETADAPPTASLLPRDRTLLYPWLGIEIAGDAFATTHDLDNLDRTEDLFLGRRFRARLGVAAEALGSDRDAAVFDASAGSGWGLGEDQVLLVDGSLEGRWASEAENVLLRAAGRYYRPTFGRHRFLASVEGTLAENLDRDVQLLLGGDSGLRGYPLRYQAGNAKLLVTLEQRFFTDWYPWRLFHVGAAVFFDAGRAWGSGPDTAPALGWLKDVGAGLRLGSSRASGKVIHLDVAFPLDGDPSIRSVQWLVRTKETL